MSKTDLEFKYCNDLVDRFEKVIEKPITKNNSKYYVGVDLGTACLTIAVLNQDYLPVAGKYRWTNVVRDGMIVDYMGAVKLVKEMKEEIEEELSIELIYAAAALPPGTEIVDGGVIKNVLEAAGFEISGIIDEPSAANKVLNIKNGAVVDIGGGTTGISILRDGKVIEVSDEATGGIHFSLVLAGAYGKEYNQAEEYKRNKKNHKEILPTLKPVIEKVASIISSSIDGHKIDSIYLVGGTSCLEGIEGIVEKSTSIKTYKPQNPLFVTPLGIAMTCKEGTTVE